MTCHSCCPCCKNPFHLLAHRMLGEESMAECSMILLTFIDAIATEMKEKPKEKKNAETAVKP